MPHAERSCTPPPPPSDMHMGGLCRIPAALPFRPPSERDAEHVAALANAKAQEERDAAVLDEMRTMLAKRPTMRARGRRA